MIAIVAVGVCRMLLKNAQVNVDDETEEMIVS